MTNEAKRIAAVDAAIRTSRPRIGAREAKLIHRLLAPRDRGAVEMAALAEEERRWSRVRRP